MIEINNPWGKQESCIFQHVIYQNGNVLRLTLVFRIILKWLTLKICQTTSEEKTQSSWNVGVWTILTTSCTHCFFFRPRYCFRYLAIRMKYYFNIICQCFSYCHFQRQLTTNRKLNQTGSVHDIHQRSRSWDRNQMSFRWFELIICLLCQFLIGTWHTFCNLGCPLPIYIQVQLYRS